MISFKDFEDKEGNANWESYRKAQIAEGEICYQCKGYILFGSGGRRLCGNCEDIEDPDEVTHESFIRCPKCSHSWNAWDNEDYPTNDSEEMTVSCSDCDHEFDVGVRITYSFTSPELIKEERESE